MEEDLPNAYKVLDQFQWSIEDMESVMLEINDGVEPEDAAADWVDANPDKVAEWTDGVE